MKIDKAIKEGIKKAANDLDVSQDDVIKVALSSFLAWHEGRLSFTQGLVEIFLQE